MTRIVMVGVLATVLVNGLVAAVADDSKDDAIKKDRKLYLGTWRAVSLVVNGNQGGTEETKKITVVNGPDNKWELQVDGKPIAKGTNSLDPTKRPREIDILPSDGDVPQEVHRGIYEIEQDTRKLCLAPPGKPRPTAFESTPGSEYILITFQREKSK